MVKKNIILTGGAGFIGSHWVKLLTKNNYNVLIFDCKKKIILKKIPIKMLVIIKLILPMKLLLKIFLIN